ncbi:MAG: DUF1827 family protein [Sporolactobacillus sp.]
MKFKDVTNESKNNLPLSVLKSKGIGDISAKFYVKGNTEILFSKSTSSHGIDEHISIQNIERPIRKNEIIYAIFKIMKHSPAEVNIAMTPTATGTIHIHYPKS